MQFLKNCADICCKRFGSDWVYGTAAVLIVRPLHTAENTTSPPATCGLKMATNNYRSFYFFLGLCGTVRDVVILHKTLLNIQQEFKQFHR